MNGTGRSYRLSGVVQGVGFRWWARERAEELGVKGNVRNLPDGSVLIRAYGERDAMDRFAASLRTGPRSAQVVSVEEAKWTPDAAPTGFSITR